MSSYIVSNQHIDTLVSWAANNEVYLFQKMTPGEAAKALHTANVDAVNYRYKENTPSTYRFQYIPTHNYTPIEIIKACDCLDYQCSDHPDWETSDEYAILNRIRSAAINQLPGYSEAAWHIAD